MVVARLREEVAEEDVAGYHKELFEDASEYHTRERVSGLLLLSSRHVLHVVESCSSTIHFLIRALAAVQNQGPSALLQEIKVLVVAHNIPSRLFPRWDVVVVTSPVTHPEDSTQSQSIEEVVAECLTLLISVADSVLKSAEDDSKASSDSLCTLAPELLIPAETIGYLCKAEECASPVDFQRMYLSPIQPALDSGHRSRRNWAAVGVSGCSSRESNQNIGACQQVQCILYGMQFYFAKLYGPFPCTYLPDAVCSQHFFLQQDSHVSHKFKHKDAWFPLQSMRQEELSSSSPAAAEPRDNCTAVGVKLPSHVLQKWPCTLVMHLNKYTLS
uniref:Testis expressed 47 n=1 Tax=Meleagris gallopavo TaxID=9103 RepID=A0A803Y0V0_MELGA